MSQSKEKLTIYLPHPTKRAVEKSAKVYGQPVSTWVERACLAQLDKFSQQPMATESKV